MHLQEHYSLKKYNTFGIEISTRYFAQFDNQEALKNLLNNHKNIPKLILGGGSNILFTQNFDGLILYNHIKGIDILKEDKQQVVIRVGAGENWADFVAHCVLKGYTGIENLALIPGTVGASPIQNIGAYGVEVKEFIQSVTAININTQHITHYPNKACQFEYRNSIFKKENPKENIILYVNFIFDKQNKTLKLDYGDIQ